MACLTRVRGAAIAVMTSESPFIMAELPFIIAELPSIAPEWPSRKFTSRSHVMRAEGRMD